MPSLRSVSRLTICRQRAEKGPIKLMTGWIFCSEAQRFDITVLSTWIKHCVEHLCYHKNTWKMELNTIFSTLWFTARLYGCQASTLLYIALCRVYTVYCILPMCMWIVHLFVQLFMSVFSEQTMQNLIFQIFLWLCVSVLDYALRFPQSYYLLNLYVEFK